MMILSNISNCDTKHFHNLRYCKRISLRSDTGEPVHPVPTLWSRCASKEKGDTWCSLALTKWDIQDHPSTCANVPITLSWRICFSWKPMGFTYLRYLKIGGSYRQHSGILGHTLTCLPSLAPPVRYLQVAENLFQQTPKFNATRKFHSKFDNLIQLDVFPKEHI